MFVGVNVGVFVGVLVGVSVAVFVGVLVGVSVGVFVGVSVGVFVGVSVGVFVSVLVGVSVGVFVGVSVGVFVGVSVGVFVGVFVAVLVGVGVAFSWMITQSDGSELGCCEGYEHTSNSLADNAPTSASTTLHEATRSCGKAAPVENGSVFCVLVEHVDEKDGTGARGWVQRSLALSPQV